MTRKLASVRRISDLLAIKDADRIELAIVDGWQVIVKKGEFSVGDLAVYFEIDSWVPNSIAPFLTKGKEPRQFNGVPGERLRTVKMKGVLSQGLLLPIKEAQVYNHLLNEGDDLTEHLNIQLYEKPLPAQLAGTAKGNFPSFIPKTDQERVQNIKRNLEKYALNNYLWEVSEKLDGSSMTVYIKDDIFGVCSRNLDLKETEENTFWKTARKYNFEEKMRGFTGNFALQGEMVGPGIQGNSYNLSQVQFFLFDVFDIDQQQYLLPDMRIAIAKALDIPHVPVYCFAGTPTLEEALQMAEGKSVINPNVEREGFVLKSMTSDDSFKVISNLWLLGEK